MTNVRQQSVNDLPLAEKHSFSVDEIAGLVGVNPKTVRKGIQDGNIKAVRVGRVIRIPRTEVLRLLGY